MGLLNEKKAYCVKCGVLVMQKRDDSSPSVIEGKNWVVIKVLGLYGAGKTTIIEHFRKGHVVDVDATIRRSDYEFAHKHIPIRVVEYAGQIKNMREWISDNKVEEVFGGADVGVIVIDTANREMLPQQRVYVKKCMMEFHRLNKEIQLHIFLHKLDLMKSLYPDDWERMMSETEKTVLGDLEPNIRKLVKVTRTTTQDNSDVGAFRGILDGVYEVFAGRIKPAKEEKGERIPEELKRKFNRLGIRAIIYVEFSHAGGVGIREGGSRRYREDFPKIGGKQLENLYESFAASDDLVSTDEKLGVIVGVNVGRTIGDEAQGTKRRARDVVLIFGEPSFSRAAFTRYKKTLKEAIAKDSESVKAGGLGIAFIEEAVLINYRELVKEAEATKKPFMDLIRFFGPELPRLYHLLLTRVGFIIEEFGESARFDLRSLAVLSPISLYPKQEISILANGDGESARKVRRYLDEEKDDPEVRRIFLIRSDDGVLAEEYKNLFGWVMVTPTCMKERTWAAGSIPVFNAISRKFRVFPVLDNELALEKELFKGSDGKQGEELGEKGADYKSVMKVTGEILAAAQRAADEYGHAKVKPTRMELLDSLGVDELYFDRVLGVAGRFAGQEIRFRQISGDAKNANPLDLMDLSEAELKRKLPTLIAKIYEDEGKKVFAFCLADRRPATHALKAIKKRLGMIMERQDLSDNNMNLVLSFLLVRVCTEVNGRGWVEENLSKVAATAD